MQKLSKDVINFLEKQGFVIVSTLDANGAIHCSAKGIIGIDSSGKVCIMDLYKNNTYKNILKNPIVSITAVDEHLFMGYTLKGKALIVSRGDIKDTLIKEWEEKLVIRISKRLINSVKRDRKSPAHPETDLPAPEYLIIIEVENIVDLAEFSKL